MSNTQQHVRRTTSILAPEISARLHTNVAHVHSKAPKKSYVSLPPRRHAVCRPAQTARWRGLQAVGGNRAATRRKELVGWQASGVLVRKGNAVTAPMLDKTNIE